MGLFDMFKKKEKLSYDPNNVKVTDLDFNFILDYDMKSWKVTEVWEYDWGDNNFTWEYKIDAGDDAAFLHVDDDVQLTLTLTRPVKIRKIDEDLVETIVKDEKPPNKLFWEGEKYYLDTDSAGYCKDHSKETNDWEEFIMWDYYNEDETKVLSITQWDERNFDAYAGEVVQEFQIENIIPADPED
ncbi:MAG: DUF4178 domain-containing protein [bacterium]|jgi:hypothetical protein|nr:DUF4178 domain-containing protein [bacterium]